MFSLIIVFLLAVVIILALALSDRGLDMLLSPLDIGQEIPGDYGDAIIVFGGGMTFYNDLGATTKERLKEACNIFNQRNMPYYISEGHLEDPDGFKRLAKKYIEEHSEKKIEPVFEMSSKNTFQNCLNTSRIADTAEYTQLIIVTSPYHQYRVNMLLSKFIPGKFMIARMHHSEVYNNTSIRHKVNNFRKIFREYIAMTKDWIQMKLFS